MSNNQRIIVRLGISTIIPALHFGELGMDIDTKTMRLGDDTANPIKIMGTKSTGDFDFSSTGTVTFNNIDFKDGGGIGGVNLAQLSANVGVVISLGGGDFQQVNVISSDGSVVISNGDGVDGDIDLRINTESLANALADIRNAIATLTDTIATLEQGYADRDDNILKLAELTGRPLKSTDLDLFLGDIIPDNSTIKTALQALETALGNVIGNALDLEFGQNTATTLVLQISDDDQVTFKGADADHAGLLVGIDKRKIDHFAVDLTKPVVDLNAIGVLSVEPEEMWMTLHQTNGVDVLIGPVNNAVAGVMLPFDKVKIDHITVTEDIDLDDLEDRVEALESNFNQAFLVVDGNGPIYESSDAVFSKTVDLSTLHPQGYAITYERVMDGFESTFYDTITFAGKIIVPAENLTKSHSGYIEVFRAKNKKWYFKDVYGKPTFLVDETATLATLNVGQNNMVRLETMSIL